LPRCKLRGSTPSVTSCPDQPTRQSKGPSLFAIDLGFAVGCVGSCVVIPGREHSISDPPPQPPAPPCFPLSPPPFASRLAGHGYPAGGRCADRWCWHAGQWVPFSPSRRLSSSSTSGCGCYRRYSSPKSTPCRPPCHCGCCGCCSRAAVYLWCGCCIGAEALHAYAPSAIGVEAPCGREEGAGGGGRRREYGEYEEYGEYGEYGKGNT
jgi:hypothetical protein